MVRKLLSWNFLNKSGENSLAETYDYQGDAQNLANLKTGSVHLICVDPPYYDNVMYSECSDFFYVWMKRAIRKGLSRIFFLSELTDKDNEAIANVARFDRYWKGKQEGIGENGL